MTPSPVSRRGLLALCTACIAAPGALAQGFGRARASAVKAAFLYKFGSFVEWPPGSFDSPVAPFVIGVYGDEAVAAELELLTQGRDVRGHPVQVERVREPGRPRGLHVLYAGGPRESRAREVLAAAAGPVLTVIDGPLRGDLAAVLGFNEDQGRVRFSASPAAAGARGLQLSAKLLAVAQHVEGH